MSDSAFQFDPLATMWEFGYWDKGWDEPDCKQHWEGSINVVMSIDEALNRAIELGFLQAKDREKVREICLTEGEFISGAEDEAGWMIGQNEDMTLTSPYPNEPLWFLLSCKNRDYCVCPVLSSNEVSELRASNDYKILTDLLTLPEILALALPDLPIDDLRYQKVFLTCLNACSAESSYVYQSQSGKVVQICRQYTEEEDLSYEATRNNSLFTPEEWDLIRQYQS